MSCPNGFGHFYRLVDLANFLKKKKFNINFICSEEQKQKVKNIKNIKFFAFYKNKNLKDNPFSFLLNFYYVKLNKYKFINDSEIIISDNIINKIFLDKKFYLISNFFWSEFKTGELKKRKLYLKLEKIFLQKNKFIFQNKYFNSKKRIKTFKISFFGNFKKKISTKKNKIFYYVSKNDRVAYRYFDLFKNFKVCTNHSKLAQKYSNFKYFKIDSLNSKHKSFKYILAKPGLNTITDAIRYKIPLITFKSNNDTELAYNIKMIKKYNIGYILEKNKERNLIDINDNSKYQIFLKNLKKFEFNGEKTIYKLLKKNIN